MSWPSNVTVPLVGWVLPATWRAKVDLPAPDGPMSAVSVPGLASSEMLSRSVLLPSMVHDSPRTSSPPVRVAASVSARRDNVPSAKTRSTLPMVTMSPSRNSAAMMRCPLTNVPLMLRLSMIWVVPPGRRHQRGVVPGCQHVGNDDVVVGGTTDRDGAFRHVGGFPRPQDLGACWSRPSRPRRAAAAQRSVRSASACFPRPAGASRAADAHRRDRSDAGGGVTGPLEAAGCGALGYTVGGLDTGGGAGQETGGGEAGPAGRPVTGMDAVWGGRPTDPVARPTSKPSSGPSGLPMLTVMPSRMSTVWNAAAVDEQPVERAVVDHYPAVVVEPKQQVGPRNKRMCDAHVGSKVAAHHHIMSGGEGALGPVIPNGQAQVRLVDSSGQL